MIPGIKVDLGAKPLAGHPGETVTEGLDGLRARLEEYAALGARFTKWRGVYRIGDAIPSSGCVTANAHALARYAAMAQGRKSLVEGKRGSVRVEPGGRRISKNKTLYSMWHIN